MNTETKTIILKNDLEKAKYIDIIWDILLKGYEKVKGGLFFKSKDELIKTTVKWKIVLSDDNNVLAVSVYKAKKGLKLVAMSINQMFRNISIPALAKSIKEDLSTCWMEISEKAEEFVMQNGGLDFIIPNNLIQKILEDKKIIAFSSDGNHYSRIIQNIQKEKILVGTPNYS